MPARTPLSRRTLLRFAAGSLALAPILAACGTSQARDRGTEELAVGFPEDSENWDPHQPPYTVSRTIARQITDTLVDQDPDTGDIVPYLARRWEVSEDGSRFTFHLRDDVTFSDGTAFTSTSVKNNFDRIIRLGSLSYIGASHLRGYQRTETPDAHTAVVVFDGPNAQFLQAATTQTLGMLADATLGKDPKDVARGDVIGSGPYVFSEYRQGQYVLLTRREDYAWGSDARSNKGPARFRTVRAQFIPDPTTLAGAVTSGQVDIGTMLDVSTLAGIKTADLHLSQVPGKGISTPLIPFIYRPIFQDAHVRRAINAATDRQEIADRIYQGNAKAATGLLTAATPGSADLSDLLRHDPDRAVAELEQAGYTRVDADGYRHHEDTGEPLTIVFMYTGSGTTKEQMLQLLQNQWKKVGIRFDLQPRTEAQLSDYTLYDAPYDLSTWSQGRADPDVLRVVYSSFYENQSFFFGHPIKEVDEALLNLQSTTDPAKRQQASEDAQRLLLDGGYSFPLVDAYTSTAASMRLAGIPLDAENKLVAADVALSG
ncbi:ABC transporter substrate-binding protein [Rothia kristinae]|uniref:ABC transporter substrate-binding protein n=1 Tax=Rothia kristinae TaxID=37923 RepID=UPI001CD44EA0|nr:ABC transporter substrate-binding protein [Rothia kristinae]MCA1170716.1 ABC transporter substrate-binding protein [Rothia kristinae]